MPHVEIDEARLFAERFRDAYHTEPSLLEALGFDSMRMLITGASDGALADPASIQQALARLHDFPGVTGKISFNEHGDAERKLTVLTVKNGEIKPIVGP